MDILSQVHLFMSGFCLCALMDSIFKKKPILTLLYLFFGVGNFWFSRI